MESRTTSQASVASQASQASQASRTSLTHDSTQAARCRVPACHRRSCSLQSHRLYTPPAAAGTTTTTGRRHGSASTRSREQEKQHGADLALARIERDGIDGLPCLPVVDRLDPELRTLFHHFFYAVFDRMAVITRPGPVGAGFKTRMLSVALTDEVYCMGLIVYAHCDMSVARTRFDESAASLMLYGKLVNVYRKRLIDIQPTQIDLMLLVLSILLSYDMIHDRLHAAEMHWEGMRRLVEVRGGIHNVGLALPYVIATDRLVAIFANKLPMYPHPGQQSFRVPLPRLPVYGAAFDRFDPTADGILSADALSYCKDSCEVLELFEISQQPGPDHDRPQVVGEYLYYRRERISSQFAQMNAKLHEHDSREWCIVLATRLAEFPVTWANYVPTLTFVLCRRLFRVLEHQDLRTVWSEHRDVLAWILTIAAIVPGFWEGREWVVGKLREMWTTKYRSKRWPADWAAVEWKSLRSFAWSDYYFKNRFHELCKELEATTLSPWEAAGAKRALSHVAQRATVQRTWSGAFNGR